MRFLALPVLLVLIGVLTGCGAPGTGQKPASEMNGQEHTPYQLSDTALTDTAGEPYSIATDADRPLTLVFYGYTQCPDECPLVMSSLTAALTRLDPAERNQVDVVFVTTDPARDTTEVLEEYLDRYDEDFIGLTGDLKDIVTLAESMRLYVGEADRLPSGGYDLGVHDTHVSAVSQGQANVVWSMNTSPKQFADDIHHLLEEVPAA
ncbi:SCO family protein [Nocardioides panzhihuensis]|uniref:Protein SCO1/2 n=1 Tax=Nocardioides panzhihuensis TaxID=860243 RepID=A0A7Z0DJP3_9ACTN|nr:SCO family protein [Nocardioides panzhihuensis]NYI76573.1 protein SCO1/2 [Nocardioides panzhihuensis]